jgi:prepilin-type N-terminal cleavage/methylation domain-containing protein
MMTKKAIRTSRQRRIKKGFTLVEMLVVAALIVVFSSIAVFNVSEYMRQGRSKAAVAEARHIATAMSFAHQDLGFFPKICFLNFSVNALTDALTGMTYDAVEYHGHNIGDLASRLQRQWKGQYLGINHEKMCKMHFTSTSGMTKAFDWPLDPWGMPYVAYLMETSGQVGTDGRHRVGFLPNAGTSPDYFAGVVSYGPNMVPGLKSDATGTEIEARKPFRLYKTDNIAAPVTGYLNFRLPTPLEYANPPLSTFGAEMIRLDVTPNPALPRIREANSDDRVYEF